LQIGSELGLGGLLIFVLIMVWTVVRLVKALRACHGSPDRSWVAATLAGYLTMLIAAQTEPMGFSQTVWIFIALADSVASVVITGRVSVKDA
jgi:hypothetical protein